MSPVVFLFDPAAEGASTWYGGDFDPAFLRALSAADPEGTTRSSVLRGDALVQQLATKITAVSAKGRHSSHVQSHDMEVYRTLIWDFADALSEQWSTVDRETFPLILGRTGVYCIAVPTLLTEFRDVVDRSLRGTMGYLGSIEIDLGSPIQRTIFVDYLVKDAAIVDGQVILELSWEGHEETLFEGADTFRPRGKRLVPYGTLGGLRPTIPIPDLPSRRGALSLERYIGKRKFSLQERVIAALAYRKHSQNKTSYAFEVSEEPSDPLEAELPEAKFVRYLLDESHPKGGPKAKFFSETLGIGPKDWRYLAAQFHDGLKQALLKEIGIKNWEGGLGANFNAVIPVRGLNGQTVEIDTNWIMEPGQRPRLSTAVPAKKGDDTVCNAPEPPVISSSLRGDRLWEEVFRVAADAGQIAAASAVPTPMSVQGFGIEMEGPCGNAWIRVQDARRGFAKWAIKSGRAYRHYRSGAQIFADVSSQSVDRAKNYANAFATVLRHNGIDCEVEWRFD